MGKRAVIKGAVAAIGFFLILGSVGALEQDVIGFGQFALQTVIGLVLFCVGALRGKSVG